MFGKNFYHGYYRKFIALFGTLFNDIHITRIRSDNTTQILKVPLIYASQDKMLARLNSDPDLTRKSAAFSPAMSFEHGPPIYDPTRKLASTLERCITDVTGTKTQYIAVPYNIEFTLYIWSKEEEDGLMVLENILPFFTPGLTLTVDLGGQLNYEIPVTVVLDGVEFQNNSFGEFENSRNLIWALKFTLKAEFGGPLSSNARAVIKKVYGDFRDTTTKAQLEEVYVQPGLTANGQPTTIEANSIPVSGINQSNNWGYVVEIIEGPKRHL